MRSERKAKVLLVITHPVMQQGLVGLLEATRDLAPCGILPEGADIIRVIHERQPDLIITETPSHSFRRIHLIQEVKEHFPHLPVLVLALDNRVALERAMKKAGADAYVTQPETKDKLLRGIRKVLRESRIKDHYAATCSLSDSAE